MLAEDASLKVDVAGKQILLLRSEILSVVNAESQTRGYLVSTVSVAKTINSQIPITLYQCDPLTVVYLFWPISVVCLGAPRFHKISAPRTHHCITLSHHSSRYHHPVAIQIDIFLPKILQSPYFSSSIPPRSLFRRSSSLAFFFFCASWHSLIALQSLHSSFGSCTSCLKPRRHLASSALGHLSTNLVWPRNASQDLQRVVTVVCQHMVVSLSPLWCIVPSVNMNRCQV